VARFVGCRRFKKTLRGGYGSGDRILYSTALSEAHKVDSSGTTGQGARVFSGNAQVGIKGR
jgi:hypothetical protein